MRLQARALRPLVFPIGEKEYAVPPVGIDAGLQLNELFALPAAERGKVKLKSVDMFKLAVTAELWDEMVADGVPLSDAFRVGMAALAHFQTLMADTGPTAIDNAEKAAQAIWESGINPEALAAWMAANQPTSVGTATNRATRRAAARTTPSTGSGTTTSTTKKPRRSTTPNGGPAGR